jgi:hypothetical protein
MVLMGSTADSTSKLTSDEIHNRNCYAYFLQLKPAITENISSFLPEFAKLQSIISQEYNENYPYGDLYSSCIAALEEKIESTPPEKIKFLDDLVQSIYHNDNQILEQSSKWINEIEAQVRPQSPNTAKKIEQRIKDNRKNINQLSPHEEESVHRRLYSLFSANFKPQLKTNLPSIKNFSYKKSSDPLEYRFSTQAQRHLGAVRVSPLFKRWLAINAERSRTEQKICHIYFNNLPYDRSKLSIAGSKERDLTLALHELEKDQDPKLKVLVITLPADAGLMKSSDYKLTTDHLSSRSVFNEFLAVAKGKRHKSGISDFFISPESRKLLFGMAKNEEKVLKNLLMQSFEEQGLAKKHLISTAQKQAVWVYFIKYALTNYILETIEPKSYNFSCKDAIDRGALSSTYYNLIKSFRLNNPISKDEFELSLDAAAANVKGRGMNFHRKIIWNSINEYVNANYNELMKDNKKSWLIYWRDMNCPHSRAPELLKIRLQQTIKQLNDLPVEKNNLKNAGMKLLRTVKNINEQHASGNRLLLEVVSRTSGLLYSSSTQSIHDYAKLAHELQINHPVLHVIGGVMEALLGILLYIPSFGYSKKWIDQGSATATTGFFADNRTKLNQAMLEFTAIDSTTPKPT